MMSSQLSRKREVLASRVLHGVWYVVLVNQSLVTGGCRRIISANDLYVYHERQSVC